MRCVIDLKMEDDCASRNSINEADLDIYRRIGENCLSIKNRRLTFQMKISVQTYLVYVKSRYKRVTDTHPSSCEILAAADVPACSLMVDEVEME